MAAKKGHSECIDALVRHGADVNKAEGVSPVGCGVSRVVFTSFCGDGQNGGTPAYVAAQNGHVACIEVLGRHGADVNKATTVGVPHSVVWGEFSPSWPTFRSA